MAEEDLSPEGGGAVNDDPQIDDFTPTDPGDNGSDASDDLAESLASELGWAPKDKWRGDESEWKDARSFLRNTVEVNKSTRRELRATREAAERAARAAAQITERALEEQRQKLLQQRDEAFDAFDKEAVNRIDQQIQKLPQSQPMEDPAIAEFKSRNAEWFQIDPDATAIAMNAAQRQADAGKSPAEQAQAAEAAVKRRFPEYFEEAKPAKQPAMVNTTGSRSASPAKGPKGFNELPAEAKRAALDFEKRGRATKEEYATLYWQENA